MKGASGRVLPDLAQGDWIAPGSDPGGQPGRSRFPDREPASGFAGGSLGSAVNNGGESARSEVVIVVTP